MIALHCAAAWGVTLINACMYIVLCGIPFPAAPRIMAYVAGILGEYAKDALLDANDAARTVQKSVMFTTSIIVMTSVAACYDPWVLWHSVVALTITAGYAVPVWPGSTLCVKTIFPCAKNVFVPAVHVFWIVSVLVDEGEASRYAEGLLYFFVSQALLTVLFDLNDVEEDRRKGVQTLATLVGTNTASGIVAAVCAGMIARSEYTCTSLQQHHAVRFTFCLVFVHAVIYLRTRRKICRVAFLRQGAMCIVGYVLFMRQNVWI